MESLPVSAEPDGIRLSSWIEQAPIGKTASYELLKALGITPGKARLPGTSAPVSILTRGEQEAMDRAAAAVAAGRSIAELTTALAPMRGSAAIDREQQAIEHHPPSGADLLGRLEAIERAQGSGAPLSTAEVAWLLGARPGGEVVTRGRVTARRHARNVWTLDPRG
jgi:hypothetical protein